MRRCHLILCVFLSSIAALLTSSAVLAEECQSKIAIWGNCVPDEIISAAVEKSKQDDFLAVVRQIYTEGTHAADVKNNPFDDSDIFPGQMAISLNSGFRYGIMGRDFNKALDGQSILLARFCEKHGGTVDQPVVIPSGTRKLASLADVKLSVCVANDKSPLAAIGTRIAQGGATRTEQLFAYYFSKQLMQSIYAFRRNIKAGDKCQFGLITDVRESIANVQLNGIAKMQLDASEKWIEIDKLVPVAFSKLPL